MSANIISLPANQYQVIDKINILSVNPAEYAPSDVQAQKNNNPFSDDYSKSLGIISLPFNSYSVIDPKNQLNNNPGETTIAEQYFQKMEIKKYGWEQFPNAFRTTSTANGYSTIPDIVSRHENIAPSKIAENQKIKENLDTYTEDFNTMPLFYKTFGKKIKGV